MKNHEHQSSPSADAASVIRDLAHAFNRWMAIDVESHKYASAGQYTHEQLRTLMYLAFQAGVKLAAPGSAIPPEGWQPEQCICAAIQLPNGEVWRGHRHDDAIHTASKAGASKADIYAAEQGFITSRNRFVGRREAARIQAVAGIVSPDSGFVPRPDRELFSEDLYLRDWRSSLAGDATGDERRTQKKKTDARVDGRG